MHVVDPNIIPVKSSFLSIEKDVETILRRLFVERREPAEILKRLLVINNRDCLDNKDSKVYKDILAKTNLGTLIDDGYIRLAPKINLNEHNNIMSYIIITMDSFSPNNTNPQFRDCIVNFDILCHPECWDLGSYRLRPLKIAGYIDGILNGCKLSGIGTFNFLGCNELVLDQDLSGYTLMYSAIHGSDDWIPDE